MKYQTGNVRGKLCLTCLALTTALLLDSAAADTIYKTVDAQGNVTFSNTPPPAGTSAQQIDLPPGPTPSQLQESQQQEQNLENMADDMESGENSDEQPSQEEQPVESTTEYQQDSGDAADDQDPVVVDDGYVGDRTRDEVARDRVDDRNEVTPGPAPVGVAHPEGRYRR
jgi:hypothetical protein